MPNLLLHSWHKQFRYCAALGFVAHEKIRYFDVYYAGSQARYSWGHQLKLKRRKATIIISVQWRHINAWVKHTLRDNLNRIKCRSKATTKNMLWQLDRCAAFTWFLYSKSVMSKKGLKRWVLFFVILVGKYLHLLIVELLNLYYRSVIRVWTMAC